MNLLIILPFGLLFLVACQTGPGRDPISTSAAQQRDEAQPSSSMRASEPELNQAVSSSGTEAVSAGKGRGSTAVEDGRRNEPNPIAFQILDYQFQLFQNDQCVLEYQRTAGPVVTLDLNLTPPCFLMRWQSPPPGAQPPDSAGVPIGTEGSPAAWRYGKGKQQMTVFLVIGDSLPPDAYTDPVYGSRLRQGWRCAGSIQGVKISADRVALSAKREHVGITCVEQELDEKEYSIAAHE